MFKKITVKKTPIHSMGNPEVIQQKMNGWNMYYSIILGHVTKTHVVYILFIHLCAT